jgi:hypothetical protein
MRMRMLTEMPTVMQTPESAGGGTAAVARRRKRRAADRLNGVQPKQSEWAYGARFRQKIALEDAIGPSLLA